MTDFRDALLKGLDSAKTAENNHREIESVFEDACEELSSVTGGTVNGALVETSFAQRLAMPSAVPKDMVQSIAFANSQRMHHAAFLARRATGYPATLIYDDQIVNFADKVGFSAALAEFLASHHSGRIILALMEAEQP